MVDKSNNQSCSVPYSIIDATRKEVPENDNEPLKKMQIDGELPHDLQGHVFIVAPVGTVGSEGLPPQDGNTYLNGDGMICRLDFDRKDEVTFKTEIVKPEDYEADQKTVGSEYLKFRNHGIIRFSIFQGLRNELNTAFLPMKFSGQNERLLITYDAGRPYEIDPVTLNVVTPVGEIAEWQSVTKETVPFRFPPIFSTAHPVFDTHTQQMFTVNYGRSLNNLLGEKKNDYITLLRDSKNRELIQPEYAEFLELLINDLSGVFINDDFVHLLYWDGESRFQKWKLIEPDNTPVSIKQTLHQIGITEDYIILIDTSFTTGIGQIINNPWPANLDLAKKIRELLQNTPSPDSIVYVIPREQLKEGEESVVVQKLTIPREACHFLADYKNPEHKITLHIAHISAWNVSEWIRSYDQSPYAGYQIPQQLHGMQQCETDVSWMGRYVIDVSSQQPTIDKKVIYDDTCTWGAGLFAYLDRLPSSDQIPEKLDNIYWVSFGLWKDLMTQFISQMYKQYPYRTIPLEKVIELAESCAKPSCLYRLNTASNEAMEIADHFSFPSNHIALSPQFVPRSGGEESSTNGYILCTVSTPKRNEIWILDAANLKQGPLCKLHHPELNFGFSLHTTWLKNINSHEASYQAEDNIKWKSYVKKMLDFMEENLSSFTQKKKIDITTEIDVLNL
ncbi:carotenoid oxygenase family protein [Nostocaceae cyanobacterium CENA369]|uniref:Carotenoid oxygenase family protein n=1 Tax=Dendronalium phyllosphericum CENA369 TaxID=1725256 RepID=A0A8J7ILD1_9NOST|nr:carotenoid oxygenase family protein [Dendronalium phyllosphericum]MBH8577985.1 carotenoid oxygenase family protein [Dendronalium phyllosphericum CENA369]